MLMNILAIGDVVGQTGLAVLSHHLPYLKEEYNIHFTVVNGENCSGVGLLPQEAEELLDAGADVITLGNHTWNRIQIAKYMPESTTLLRPANYTHLAPGRGWGVYTGPEGVRIGVINLIGRLDLDTNAENPFFTADHILEEMDADIILVDFHAEATSEKGAMGYYLDGRVQAVWGTHTHVPTADTQILPKGTGFVTDLGMTGAIQSVLGMRPDQAINRFLGGVPQRFETPNGAGKLECVVFTIDSETKECVNITRADIWE